MTMSAAADSNFDLGKVIRFHNRIYMDDKLDHPGLWAHTTTGGIATVASSDSPETRQKPNAERQGLRHGGR
jgi:hypothetical protein